MAWTQAARDAAALTRKAHSAFSKSTVQKKKTKVETAKPLSSRPGFVSQFINTHGSQAKMAAHLKAQPIAKLLTAKKFLSGHIDSGSKLIKDLTNAEIKRRRGK